MSSEPAAIPRFVAEAKEHLPGMAAAVMELERGEGDLQGAVEKLLRAAHSIKGGAGFTGCRKIEQLSHALEEALENIRDGFVPINPDVVDTLLAVLDRIVAMVDDAEHSEESDITALQRRLQPLIDAESTAGELARVAAVTQEAPPQISAAGLTPVVLAKWKPADAWLYGVRFDWNACEREHTLDPEAVANRVERAGSVLEARTEFTGQPLSQGLPAPALWWLAVMSSPHAPAQFAEQLGIPSAAIVVLRERTGSTDSAARPPVTKSAPAPAASLRVGVKLIDRLVELAGELSLVRNQTVRATDPSNVALRNLSRRLDAVTNEVQDTALRMRMQPVGTLFDRFPRLVRDVARQLDKQIELVITGSELSLDKAILEMLADPLTHLIRNSCDHGIEPPEQRIKAGKPATGVIRLSARQDRGQMLIEIRDDGRGINRDAVMKKALAQGIKRKDELDRLSDRQVFDLILLSGFSTAERVTDISGRGVGMDVVKTNLDQIGGVVEIDSWPGGGTLFNLRLPLTLAIVPCLLLVSGDQRYALPQRDVEEVLLVDAANGKLKIECSRDEELLRLRGELLPVVRLAEVLERRQAIDAAAQSQIIQKHHRSGAPRRPMYAAVIRVGSRRFALAFDRVIESESIVVKPLHPILRPLGSYAGVAILGDGSVSLILSSEGLARHSGVMHRPVSNEPAIPATLPEVVAMQGVLLFRYGASELLAIPLAEVRRVVMISKSQIQSVGDRELVDVDGAALNVVRLDRFINLSPFPDQEWLFLILPRHAESPVAVLASEIVDAPNLPVKLDERAFQSDGVVGSAMVRGQVALFLDSARIVEMWQQIYTRPRPLLTTGTGKRVLVVEDTRFFQRLISGCLQQAGYTFELASDGSEGLKRLTEAGPFDLIVSDLEMPVMNGLEFAKRVRSDARYASLPMLALTTLNTDENRARAADSGFDAYEVKFDRPSFLAAVAGLLKTGRATGLATPEGVRRG